MGRRFDTMISSCSLVDSRSFMNLASTITIPTAGVQQQGGRRGDASDRPFFPAASGATGSAIAGVLGSGWIARVPPKALSRQVCGKFLGEPEVRRGSKHALLESDSRAHAG